MFEFWLGMLELGIQFPSMFGGWGANLENCLAGLEESFWLFSNSCRHADTVNTKRNRSRKAHIPQIENVMVSEVSKQAGVYELLDQQRITRMPTIPTANYDQHEMVEISSDEEDEGQDDDPSAPTVRGSRKDQASGETEVGEGEIEVDEEEEDEGGQPSEAKKRRTDVRSIREQFDTMIKEASQVKFCFQCGGERNLEECPHRGDDLMANALNRMRTIMEEQSKSPSSSSEKSKMATATRGRKDKLPKKGVMPQGKRWNRTRFTEKEEVSKSFYSQPAYMFEIGDREEGGPLLVNGVEVHRPGEGVQNRAQLDLLVELAAQESPVMIPSIRELNAVNPDNDEELQRMIQQDREQYGPNWNFRPIQPHTYGTDIGTLEIARISSEDYVGIGWCDVYKWPENAYMGRRHETPPWIIEMSKRFNAALSHSVVCVQDKKNQGLPCDEAGWANVEQILKYNHIWKDGQYLAGTTVPDFNVITKRWDAFQKIILTEFKQTRRVRAQVLALKVTKEELEKVIHLSNRFTRRIRRVTLRLEIGNPDREIWLWPVAIRAPMAHTKNPGGVVIEDHKTNYHLNPSVGNTLGGGFHVTTFDCMAQIFNEGLRPGGGGDRINTFFVPFAPWDERCVSVLRYKKIEVATLVYIYLTYESLSKFNARISADGHILVQQTIPFNSFDAVWYRDQFDLEYYRLLITKGYEQLVLSVRGAKKIATVNCFDHLIENVAQDDSSPDKDEILKLLNIKNDHMDIQSGMRPFHSWQLHIVQTRKDTYCVQHACPRLQHCCLFVSTAKAA